MAEKKFRITKAQKFAAAIAYLTGAEVPTITNAEGETTTVSVEDCVTALNHEIELLSRKNKSDSSKLSKTQQENETHKNNILAYLAEQTEGKSCTDIANAVDSLVAIQAGSQKVSPLMRQLKEAGMVRVEVVKGRPLFYLA